MAPLVWLAATWLASSLAAAQTCQLQFDGRVPADLVGTDFDVANGIFSEAFVLGEGLVFSQALRLLPVGAGSLVRLILAPRLLKTSLTHPIV